MKKIAFVAVRYGQEVNGGAEVHCRMLAERLTPEYEVEVLTTTIREFGNPSKNYPAGESMLNGVRILRFEPVPILPHRSHYFRKKCNLSKKIRYRLDTVNLLRPLANLFPIWNLGLNKEIRFFQSREEYSPALLDHLKRHKSEYAAVIPICYFFATTIFTALTVPEKTILIPTAHPEKPLYFSIYTHVFNRIRHIAFNTRSEQALCKRIFGNKLAESSIVGVGIDRVAPAPWTKVQADFNLPDRYTLYLGRVTHDKIQDLFDYFGEYVRTHDTQAKLVVVGGIDPYYKINPNPNILLTGFVSDAEKAAIVSHASAMVNPSHLESLSLLALEAMSERIPLLVNGHCAVLRDHCVLSEAALWYDNRKEFVENLHRLLTDKQLRLRIEQKGPEYIAQNYSWEIIIPKLHHLIEQI